MDTSTGPSSGHKPQQTAMAANAAVKPAGTDLVARAQEDAAARNARLLIPASR